MKWCIDLLATLLLATLLLVDGKRNDQTSAEWWCAGVPTGWPDIKPIPTHSPSKLESNEPDRTETEHTSSVIDAVGARPNSKRTQALTKVLYVRETENERGSRRIIDAGARTHNKYPVIIRPVCPPSRIRACRCVPLSGA